MDDIQIVPNQVMLQPGARPRAGALPRPDGKYDDADMEVVIQICVGCVKSGPSVLDAQGQGHGVMVPVGLVSRPWAEVKAEALKVLSPKPTLVSL